MNKPISQTKKKFHIYEQEKIQQEIKKTYNLLYTKLLQKNIAFNQNLKSCVDLSMHSEITMTNFNKIKYSIPNTDRSYEGNNICNTDGPLNSNLDNILGNSRKVINAEKQQKSLLDKEGNLISDNNKEKLSHPNQNSRKMTIPIFVPSINTIKVDKNFMLKLNNQIRENNTKLNNNKLNNARDNTLKIDSKNIKGKPLTNMGPNKDTLNSKQFIGGVDFKSPHPQKKKFLKMNEIYPLKKIRKQVDLPIDKSQNIYLSDYIFHVERNFLKPTDDSKCFNYLHRRSVTESDKEDFKGNLIRYDKINETFKDSYQDGEISISTFNRKSKIPLNIYIEKGNLLRKKLSIDKSNV